MAISKEVKVGIMAVVCMVMLYFGVSFLKGADFFSSDYKYYVLYDNIDNLQASNPVVINGFPVGRVTKIELLPEFNNKILVTLNITKKLQIKKVNYAMLKNSSLLGGKAVYLQIDSTLSKDTFKAFSVQYYKPKDTLRIGIEKDMIAGITSQVTPIIKRVDTIMVAVENLLREFEGVGKVVKGTLTSAEATASTLNMTITANRAKIDAMLANLTTLSANIIETEKGFKPILGKMNTFADSLNALRFSETVNKANATIAQFTDILAKVNKGEGSLGALLKDKALYDNLNNLSINIDKLIIDLRLNPKRYIKISAF